MNIKDFIREDLIRELQGTMDANWELNINEKASRKE